MSEETRRTEPDSFEDRLRAARARSDLDAKPAPRGRPQGSALGIAMRAGVELLSAFLVAGAIGWLMDRWLGTTPWLMVAMLPVGAAAGFLNLYRLLRSEGFAAPPPPAEPGEAEETGREDGRPGAGAPGRDGQRD